MVGEISEFKCGNKRWKRKGIWGCRRLKVKSKVSSVCWPSQWPSKYKHKAHDFNSEHETQTPEFYLMNYRPALAKLSYNAHEWLACASSSFHILFRRNSALLYFVDHSVLMVERLAPSHLSTIRPAQGACQPPRHRNRQLYRSGWWDATSDLLLEVPKRRHSHATGRLS